MSFHKPMLAGTLKPDTIIDSSWVIQEKYDGHRMIVDVKSKGGDLFDNPAVVAYSRNEIERPMPPHVLKALEQLPSGIYDGELVVPGQRSYGVPVIDDQDKLVFICFDLLEILGRSVVHLTFEERNKLLVQLFAKRTVPGALELAWTKDWKSPAQAKKIRDEVWKRDGEGLILKLRSSKYAVGKRNKDWLKVKKLQSAVLTVVGFRDGRMGPHATVVLRDDEGNITTVKTLNMYELTKFDEGAAEKAIGRKLVIEYQERTPDGSYRHPRWDRWENE